MRSSSGLGDVVGSGIIQMPGDSARCLQCGKGFFIKRGIEVLGILVMAGLFAGSVTGLGRWWKVDSGRCRQDFFGVIQ